MELNPNLVEGHAHYCWYLHLFRRNEEALAEARKAEELDPLTPIYTAWVAWLYVNLGQSDKAIDEARKSLEIDPNLVDGLYVLGSAYGQKKMFAEAIAVDQKLATVNPEWKHGLAETYALAGRRDDALGLLAEMEREDYSRFGLDIFTIQTILGNQGRGLRRPRRSVRLPPHLPSLDHARRHVPLAIGSTLAAAAASLELFADLTRAQRSSQSSERATALRQRR